MVGSGWVLVVGYGSIGRRHYKNLRSLGVRDVRLLRSGRPATAGFETPDGTRVYLTIEEALADSPAVVVVCNPTSLHVETAAGAVEAGAAVVLEKPVGSTVESSRWLLRRVRELAGTCSMAYCFRYHPLYRFLHDVVYGGDLGRVFHVRTWQSSYLPDWHPWEDYRSGYAARSDLGGGVVRTLDHELDIVRWLLGDPMSVLGSVGSLSGLDVDVEDTADMVYRYEDRKQAHVHVCFGQRRPSRGVCVTGEQASATLDWNRGTVEVGAGQRPEKLYQLPEDYDLNAMYVDMMRDALQQFGRDPRRSAIDLSDGVAALNMAEAALLSSERGVAVQLSNIGTS